MCLIIFEKLHGSFTLITTFVSGLYFGAINSLLPLTILILNINEDSPYSVPVPDNFAGILYTIGK